MRAPACPAIEDASRETLAEVAGHDPAADCGWNRLCADAQLLPAFAQAGSRSMNSVQIAC